MPKKRHISLKTLADYIHINHKKAFFGLFNPISIFIVIFGININLANAALTAKTANVIEGRKPYLSDKHIQAISNEKDFELLGLDIDGNQYYSNEAITNAIKSGGVSLGKLTPTTLVKTLGTGTGTMKVIYQTPVITTDALDNDGDGFIAGSLTGSATVNWYYKDSAGAEKALTTTTSTFCDLASIGIVPYLRISGPVSLSTEYGVPRTEVYNTSNTVTSNKLPVRRFYPRGVGEACWARPNLTRGASPQYSQAAYTAWDPAKGFKPQNVGTPSSNFPRTGFHGAFFDIILVGVSAADVVKYSESTSGIVDSTSDVKLKLTAAPNITDTHVLRVELEGPRDPSGGNFASPATFKLYSDAGKTNVVYSFALSKWFIARPGKIAYDTTVGVSPAVCTAATCAPNYCASLASGIDSYRVPSVGEYTNGNSIDWTLGLSGWSHNNYARAIGNGRRKTPVLGKDDGTGGLFAEWGFTANNNASSPYNSSKFEVKLFWAIDSFDNIFQYTISSHDGYTGYDNKSYLLYGTACVSP